MINKILTIIVPSYNMERYLGKCLRSLLCNSRRFLQVIIVNDGSNDSTLSIAKDYSQKYPETFEIIDKKNGNYGSCINHGLQQATGKYIKVLDADDYFDTNNLELYIQALHSMDYDLIITDYEMVDESGKILNRWGLPNREQEADSVSNVKWSDLEDKLFQMHAVTFKTENIKKINYHQTEGISYTDQEWMFLPMQTVKTIHYINLVLYKYLIGRLGQTVSSDAYVKNSHALMQISRNMVQKYIANNLKGSYFYFRLKDQLERLYYIYIIRKNDNTANQEITEFDFWLDSSLPEISSKLNKSKLFSTPFNYIKYWRSNHNNNSLIFKLIRNLMYFARKIK